MARISVYLPDALAAEARALGLNVSGVLQEALRDRVHAARTSEWVAGLRSTPVADLDRADVLAALGAVRRDRSDDGSEGGAAPS